MTSSSQNDDLRAAWFGQVSPHWKLGRAKNAFSVVSKKVGARSSEYDLLSLTLKGIIPRDLDSGKGKFPESFDTYQEVKKGDIVFCLFDIDETPRTVGLSNMDGMITGAYTVVRCTELADPRYVTYFYLSIDERKGLRPFYTGLRKVVRTETFLNAAFPLTDLPTQRAIADFLDRETARIDLLIEKKQRLVVLLAEKLSSFVEKLVAFGPDDACGKIETGNAWFSKIASGVQLLPIKRVARLVNGYGFSSEDLGEEGVPVIRIGDVGASIDPESAKKFTGVQSRSLDQFIIRNGDILIAMTGATIGKFGVYDSDTIAYLNQRVGILRANGIDRMYLSNCLRARTFAEQMKLFAYGGAQPNIGSGEIGSILIPVPSREVQKVIVGLFQTQSEITSSTSVAVKASIDRLKEYRSALITAAVTGQIDVTERRKSGAADRQLDAIHAELDV